MRNCSPITARHPGSQFSGMGWPPQTALTRMSIYLMAYGIAPASTDKIAVLRDKVDAASIRPGAWSLPGYGACILNATENVQGRLINGVAAERVCCTPASSHTQKFIHIEQDPDFRTPRDWIAPVTDTFP